MLLRMACNRKLAKIVVVERDVTHSTEEEEVTTLEVNKDSLENPVL